MLYPFVYNDKDPLKRFLAITHNIKLPFGIHSERIYLQTSCRLNLSATLLPRRRRCWMPVIVRHQVQLISV